MTLHSTLAIWAFAAVLTLAVLALVLWQAGDDQKERKAVPVRQSVIALAAGLVLSLGAGLVSTNITTVSSGERARASGTYIQIASSFTLRTSAEAPSGDILAGNNELDDPVLVRDLAAGKSITLKTGSGTPAAVQLFATGDEILPVVTYDGKEEPTITASFTDKAINKSGFPQLLRLPVLPPR